MRTLNLNKIFMKAPYKVQQFDIPDLKGISKTTIEEHLKLYAGYVSHTNLILEEIENRKNDDPYAIAEMQRRFSFEFDGMRNHEVYFSSLEGGPINITNAELRQRIEYTWGSFDNWLERFKTIAKTRGVGWAVLYLDPKEKLLLNGWVDEQQMGHLAGCHVILALDMWEHSFVADYQPSGKTKYIDDFFENLNWTVIERNFNSVIK